MISLSRIKRGPIKNSRVFKVSSASFPIYILFASIVSLERASEWYSIWVFTWCWTIALNSVFLNFMYNLNFSVKLSWNLLNSSSTLLKSYADFSFTSFVMSSLSWIFLFKTLCISSLCYFFSSSLSNFLRLDSSA